MYIDIEKTKKYLEEHNPALLQQLEEENLTGIVCTIIEQYKQGQVEPEVKPVDYGTCKNCIFNLEQDENSLVSECQLTIDEFTGIGLQFSRDFGCNQWQSKPSV